MKVLNETYVANDISMNKLDRLVGNISADNFIFFNDDKIPPGGMGSTKALHITTRCKGYTLPGVLTDNGSTLKVLPLSTLNRLPMDSSHMKTCQNIARAFDGTERRVMGKIEIPLLIGPSTYEVDFLVMDIKPSYNCLLGRPWIHSAGAVPSSLHQKLKLLTEGRLVTINAEEDIIVAVTSDAPYIGTEEEVIECSFRSLEFVNATFIVEGNKIPTPRISKTTRMSLQMMAGRGAPPGKGFGKFLQGRMEVPILVDKRDCFGLGYRPDARQKRKEVVKYSEWVANIIPVPKKDGKVRMCVEYRDLNKVSPKDNFSLPHIDTLVDNTVGYSLFSFMDGFSGYNQIRMHPEDIEKTTFIIMWGIFCYKVMSFGLKIRKQRIREPW
ncbi:uncharacterized protein LOC105797473 [Gossypium raimondii]|uniref:uncharacterized protein LOC105797473 n=1 Tax=Gossypium raimondii TaxID=29730 RepID=UPI00063AC0AA|nr:uncharacterized protein LOC105797473 [Gossypium raimondii]